MLFGFDLLINKLTQGELITLDDTVDIYKKRLYDISWFMRDLNEHIAREAILGTLPAGQLKLF